MSQKVIYQKTCDGCGKSFYVDKDYNYRFCPETHEECSKIALMRRTKEWEQKHYNKMMKIISAYLESNRSFRKKFICFANDMNMKFNHPVSSNLLFALMREADFSFSNKYKKYLLIKLLELSPELKQLIRTKDIK